MRKIENIIKEIEDNKANLKFIQSKRQYYLYSVSGFKDKERILVTIKSIEQNLD